MALTTRNEIREIIETDWRETLQEARYIEDALGELADSLIPAYTHERIAEWVELPNDFTDCGSDLCVPEDGIVQRMTCDLYEYYRQTVESVWREIEAGNVCSIGGDNHSDDFVTVYEGNEEPAVFCGYHALIRDRFAPAN